MFNPVVQKRVEEHYEHVKALGYDVFACFAHGSWNYAGLSDNSSDVDTRCLIIPSFNDLFLNKKPVSKTIILDNNEQSDIKDIRHAFNLFKKGNPNMLEILFSEYYVVPPASREQLSELIERREDIATANLNNVLNAALGQIFSKQSNLTKITPATEAIILEHGYNGKDLMHAHRVLRLIETLVNGGSFAESLNACEIDSELLLAIKRNKYPLIDKDNAVKSMEHIVALAREMINQEYEVNTEVHGFLDDILLEIGKNRYGI